MSASTVAATKVYARKGGRCNYQALYVDDGVYGSFNNVVYDHFHPVPKKVIIKSRASKKISHSSGGLTDDDDSCADSESDGEQQDEAGRLVPSAVFGPTCDGLDQLCGLEDTLLPRCEVDDWLMWENMGAYTHTASFVFNGYTHLPQKTYCFSI